MAPDTEVGRPGVKIHTAIQEKAHLAFPWVLGDVYTKERACCDTEGQ